MWKTMCRRLALATGVAWVALTAPAQAQAEDPAPSPGVTDLKFRDMFKLPVGPRGLEPSAALLALAGQTVRIVGYMVRQSADLEVPGLMILVPLPVNLGDEDETFADDLPASAVYVHPAEAPVAGLPFVPGLLAMTGTLQLGAQAEPDGRISFVRLQLPGASFPAPMEKAP